MAGNSPAESPFGLDHVSIFTAADAPEAKTLEALGLRGFGGTTRHGDLGTASTSFFFDTAYLELFWIHDAVLAKQNASSSGIDAEARMNWRVTGAAPFGLMFSRRTETATFPFATRKMAAVWMPGEVYVEFAVTDSSEPYYGIVPPVLAYPSFKANIAEPDHPIGARRLTGVQITLLDDISPIARWITEAGLATIKTGSEPLMTLILDDGVQGKTIDVRPTLSLVLKY